ncbi:MAG: amidohydrolase family protein [Pseudomonadota bacterium]
MTSIKTGLLAGLISVGLAACSSAPTPPPQPVDIAITNVTVIDPGSNTVTPQQTVLVTGSQIVAVLNAGSGRFSADETIDATGKYLIPGLMDMHVHTSIKQVLDPSLKLMLANGVTGVRDMSADCWEPRGELFLCIDEMRTIAAEIEAGDRIGPRYLKLSSSFVQSDKTGRLPDNHDPKYTPITREDGVVIAAYLDERGVDLIKLYHAIFHDAFAGLMEEANRRGIEVSGHVPLLDGATAASNAGVRTFEHAKEIVTDCSDYTVEYRAAMNAVLKGEEGAAWPKEADRVVGTIETFNADRCREMMQVFAANNTYYVPTHGTREFDFRASEADYQNNPNLRFIGAFQLGDWKNDLNRTAKASPKGIELYRQFYDTGLTVTKIAFDNNVKVMLGTDANDTMIIPGFAVHEELERLVAAGLSPMEALQAATSVPADYVGMPGEIGRVAQGYRADLVLLTADPLSDIRNTSTIESVIVGGIHNDRASLDQMLSEVEQTAAASNKETGE